MFLIQTTLSFNLLYNYKQFPNKKLVVFIHSKLIGCITIRLYSLPVKRKRLLLALPLSFIIYIAIAARQTVLIKTYNYNCHANNRTLWTKKLN